MSTSHIHSAGGSDTNEQITQQQRQHGHSTFDNGGHLPRKDTELNMATTPSGLSFADDYGVKSMDDLLPSSKPVESIPVSSLAATDNTPTCTSTNPLHQVPSHIEHPNYLSNISHDAAATATTPTASSTVHYNSDRNMDQDDTSTSTSNTSGYDNYYNNEDEDDSFSCLTGDVSQSCFYGHANDSTATWHSSMSDSNIDLVVPKVNIRPGKQPSNVMNSYRKPSSQSIGYLSIMVCGDSGIGKTALIHSFSLMPEIMGGQLSTSLETDSLDATQFGNGDSIVMDISTEQNISAEIKKWYASTMVSSSCNQSQKQVDALDRNICFIDTPGYGAFVDAKAVIRSTTKYLERQFQQTNDMLSPTQPNTPKLSRLLHNQYGGHSHVDVCLYLILDRIKPVDIEYLRSIQQLCNILPVIVKTDLLSYDQEQTLKRKVLQELHDSNIQFYQCGYSFEQLLELCQKDDHDSGDAPPFSISIKPLNSKHYHKTHSAKGYLKLMHLKDTLFYEHVDSLRQSTVTKFMTWRREQTNIQQAYRSQQYRNHQHASTSPSTSSSYTAVVPTSSSSSSVLSVNNTKRSQQKSTSSVTEGHHLTTMLDLETMTQKLATREIAERIQDLASKQRRSINLHMVNYINEQRQRLEQQKQERLIQLQQKYHIMTQQEKIKFLTCQLNGVLADFGLLIPGELNTGILPHQQQKETTTSSASASSSSVSSSVWHIYPPPDVIDHGLVVLKSSSLYFLAAMALVVIFISGVLKWSF